MSMFWMSKGSELVCRKWRVALLLQSSLNTGESLATLRREEILMSDHAWLQSWEPYDTYVVDSDDPECPELARLVKDALQGEFDIILTPSVDHLLRGRSLTFSLREELLFARVHLATMDAVVDTISALTHLYDSFIERADMRCSRGNCGV